MALMRLYLIDICSVGFSCASFYLVLPPIKVIMKLPSLCAGHGIAAVLKGSLDGL